jgi:hypothetical protein
MKRFSIWTEIVTFVKPAHAVTTIKQSPVFKGYIFLSCHRKFHMNWTPFKTSPVLCLIRTHFVCVKGDYFCSNWKSFHTQSIILSPLTPFSHVTILDPLRGHHMTWLFDLKTGDVLKGVQFIWNFLWQDKKM